MKTPVGWKKYYGTWRPTSAPHENANISCIKNGTIWRRGGLARWISDFDCECQTDFWYCIKDSPFDINGIKSKKRYYIKKGIEHFDVREIKIVDYLDDLYIITDKALQTYNDYAGPEDKSTFVKELCSRDDLIYLGAFDKETKKLCGYIKIKEYESYVDFMSMKSDPESEKNQINAAMVMALCEKYAEKLNQGGFYICDGMRAINHETNFQNWLKKKLCIQKGLLSITHCISNGHWNYN